VYVSAKHYGEMWTKNVGGYLWDNLLIDKLPKLIDKIPYAGEHINRARLYEYRSNLKKSKKFIEDMEDMHRRQALGKEYALDLGTRLQSVPEPSQLRIGEAITGGKVKLEPKEKALVKEVTDTFLELGKHAVDLDLLDAKEFFINAGRYMPRLYTKSEYAAKVKRFNVSSSDKLDLSRFEARQDIPKKIRKQMGEILTPGYPVAKGIVQLVHDIELGKFFREVSRNKDWAQPKGSKAPIPEGWKKLKHNTKLGKLSEAYVHPEVFRDISSAIRVRETGEIIFRRALGYWKFGKVVLSPKTHARNMMSNSILAHLGGLPMYEQGKYLGMASKAMKEGSQHFRDARKTALLSNTFINAELKGLFNEVSGIISGSELMDMPGRFGKIGEVFKKGKSFGGKAARAYEWEEHIFKMAKYIHNRERKNMSIKDAALDAEKWLFNYSKVTKFQEAYRGGNWVGLLAGAPFATFTLKAIPRITEAAIKTPWRYALPYAMIYGLEEAARGLIGDTKEQAKAKKGSRPEWMKAVNIMGVETFPRVPYVDDYGREHYLNLQFVLPWGDVAESGGFMGIPGGVRPMSMPVVSELSQQIMNYDTFWKQPIIPEEEVAGKNAVGKATTTMKYRGKHFLQTASPTAVVGAAKIAANLIGKPDFRGREKSLGLVLADEIAGVKIYPVNYAEVITRKIIKTHPKKGILAKRIRSQIRTLAIKRHAMKNKGKNIERYNKAIDSKVEQLRGLAKEIIDEATTYKKTLKKE